MSDIDINNYIDSIINDSVNTIYKKIFYNTKITVCDKCLTAACWDGEFMCKES